jgi:hypothetical protein
MGTNGNANTWANGLTGAGMATMMGGTGIGFGTTAMGLGRDPKARAKSRDYLKQSVTISIHSFSNSLFFFSFFFLVDWLTRMTLTFDLV